jgi:DNA invertase Pin-like site-specific DNA recombinase
MPDQTNNQRAAILARCSSEANVCSQVLLLRQFARDKYIVEEDDVYGDNISGSSAISERQELKRLMQNIEKKKKQYDVILVQDATRLGKHESQVQEITGWFTKRNIALHFHPLRVAGEGV